MVIRRGSAAILLIGAGGVLSGCALPFAGSLAFTDLLPVISIFSTAATGKGVTEIALDVVTGQDCRLLEGALREDRDFCEEPGSAATDDDFKGVVAWLEDDAPASPVPGGGDDASIMVADIDIPHAAPRRPVFPATASLAVLATSSTEPRPVALASLSELPDDWIVLASLSGDAAGLGAGAPAAGTPGFIHAKLSRSPLPIIAAAQSPDGDLADWGAQKMPAGATGIAERALTMPILRAKGSAQSSERHDVHWNNLWPAVDIENPPLQQDVLRRAVSNKELAASDAAPQLELTPLTPAPAKPLLHAVLPHPKKPMLQAATPGQPKNAQLEMDFLRPAPDKQRPMPEDGPVLALLPSVTSVNRIK